MPTPPKNSRRRTPDFVPSDEIIGQPGLDYLDPEFILEGGRVRLAFWRDNSIFVTDADPATGRLVGPEQCVAAGAIAFIRSAFQGPEWGFNESSGPCVYFTVSDTRGRYQVARSRPPRWEPEVLTDPLRPLIGNVGISASKTLAESNLILYARFFTEPHWFWRRDGAGDTDEHPVEGRLLFHTQPPHWIERGDASELCDIVCCSREADSDEEPMQIARYDTAAGRVHTLTDDPAFKWDADSFFAPEHGGARVYIAPAARDKGAVPDRVAVYKEESGRRPYASLKRLPPVVIPPEAAAEGYNQISSADPVLTTKYSFLSARLVKPDRLNPNERTSSIWLLRLDNGFARKVSGDVRWQGDFSGKDPEVVLGAEEIFVYYYNYAFRPRARVELHMCRTYVSRDGDDLWGIK